MRNASPYLRDRTRKLREPSITRLNRVPIADNGEALLDVRVECPRVIAEAPLPWLRETACAMLNEASRALPRGMSLLSTTCLRTLDMQAAAWHAYRDHLRERHPEWPTSVLHRETNRFLHPPHSPAPPGHTTGGAVDVRLVSETGEDLDGAEEPAAGGRGVWRTFSGDVAPRAAEARRILYDAMVGSGFTNCYDEWWHYSYGDSGWAARSGTPIAVYGAVPEEAYPEELARQVAAVRLSGQLTRVRRRLG